MRGHDNRRAIIALTCALALSTAACEPYVDDVLPGDSPTAADDREDQADVRGDVDCSRRALGEDAAAVYLTAHEVIDGELGAVCLGNRDPLLVDIWDTLATIAPAELREDLSLFTLFEDTTGSEDPTLAFVIAVDDEGSSFQMAFNVDESEADDDELLLTIAHEFSHVFTGTRAELDRIIHPADCTTYDNGEGCYREGSMMLAWIDAFWPADELASIDTSADPWPEDGEARCDADPGFFGSYAATTPEEDFAEAFSAFVMRVEPETGAQAARLAWFEDWPVLADVRDRAAAADLGPLDHGFDACGLG